MLVVEAVEAVRARQREDSELDERAPLSPNLKQYLRPTYMSCCHELLNKKINGLMLKLYKIN